MPADRLASSARTRAAPRGRAARAGGLASRPSRPPSARRLGAGLAWRVYTATVPYHCEASAPHWPCSLSPPAPRLAGVAVTPAGSPRRFRFLVPRRIPRGRIYFLTAAALSNVAKMPVNSLRSNLPFKSRSALEYSVSMNDVSIEIDSASPSSHKDLRA